MVIVTDTSHPQEWEHQTLLRLLQLASPALPVGAYSYSEGLEALVEAHRIDDLQALEHWLCQELTVGAIRLEVAVMVRTYRAVQAGDWQGVVAWNQWLSAVRETEELRSQSWQMGRSLLRLFQDLQPGSLEPRLSDALLQEGGNFAIAFGLVAAHWQIEPHAAVLGYLQSWATNLINAGIKLIPLGQTAGQQLLLRLGPTFSDVSQSVLDLRDGELDSCGWGLALASMAHETQYSRLFRS